MAYVVGIDLGSQSMKGVLLDSNGSLKAEASSSYDISFPEPGWAEQNPRVWFKALKEIIPNLLRISGIRAADIGTIGFASQVDGVVAIDQYGEPLRPAILWMDRRSEDSCKLIRKSISPVDVMELTGLNIDSYHVAPKILWIRDHEPMIFSKTKAFLLPGSYMVYLLTGERVLDYSNASSTMLYDIRTKNWSNQMLGITGLEASQLGHIQSAEQVAGHLTVKAAKQLGLSPYTRVITGCGDEHAACLGAGLIIPGILCDIVGTAEAVAIASDRPIIDPTGLVETHAHADKRWWLIENPGFVSGGSLRWFSDVIARESYAEMSLSAEKVPPGSDGLIFLPCLSGSMTPKWNANAKGTFYGLTMKHSVAHMTRSVFEGCTYGFRDIIQRFHELSIDCQDIRLVGGGAKSQLWCQIKADATGYAIKTIKETEAAAIGAAMLAGVAEGTFISLDEAVEKLVKFDKVYTPDHRLKSVYDESYGLYRDLFTVLEPLYEPRN